ncbi:MAG TPA: Wzy polymerase domain-containing protein, partial [Ramlibacter sp.]
MRHATPTLNTPAALTAAALAFLPWVNPFAPGPSPTVVPWMASAACALALWLMAVPSGVRIPRGLACCAVALVLWGALWHPVRPELAMLAGGLLLILLAAGFAQAEGMARALQAGVLAAACASTAMALLQYFGEAAAFAPLVSMAPAGQAYANLRQPNQFASLCCMGIAVLLWAPWRLPRPAALLLVLLLAVGSAASASRTAMLQGGLLIALAFLWRGPQRRWRLALVAGAAVAYLAAVWMLPWLLELSHGAPADRTLWKRVLADTGCSSRVVLWSNVLQLLALKPLAGWGWGNLDYAHYLTLYPGARFCDILDNAHNLPLHLAVELGLPAAVLACVVGLAWAWRRQPWREDQPTRQLAWAWIGLMLLHGMVEYPLWYGPFQIAFGAALGWLAHDALAAERGVDRPATALVLLLVPALAYAAWDYLR